MKGFLLIIFVLRESRGLIHGFYVCRKYLFWYNCTGILMEMFCYGKIVRPHHEDNGFLEEKVKLLLLDERRALIRKFAIKRDDDRMKGINKVH